MFKEILALPLQAMSGKGRSRAPREAKKKMLHQAGTHSGIFCTPSVLPIMDGSGIHDWIHDWNLDFMIAGLMLINKNKPRGVPQFTREPIGQDYLIKAFVSQKSHLISPRSCSQHLPYLDAFKSSAKDFSQVPQFTRERQRPDSLIKAFVCQFDFPQKLFTAFTIPGCT